MYRHPSFLEAILLSVGLYTNVSDNLETQVVNEEPTFEITGMDELHPDFLEPYRELFPNSSDDELYEFAQKDIPLEYIAQLTPVVDLDGTQLFDNPDFIGTMYNCENEASDATVLTSYVDSYDNAIFPTGMHLAYFLCVHSEMGLDTLSGKIGRLTATESPIHEGRLTGSEIFGYLIHHIKVPKEGNEYDAVSILPSDDYNGAFLNSISRKRQREFSSGKKSATYFVSNDMELERVLRMNKNARYFMTAGHGDGISQGLGTSENFSFSRENLSFDIWDEGIFLALSELREDVEFFVFSCYAGRPPTLTQQENGAEYSLQEKIGLALGKMPFAADASFGADEFEFSKGTDFYVTFEGEFDLYQFLLDDTIVPAESGCSYERLSCSSDNGSVSLVIN